MSRISTGTRRSSILKKRSAPAERLIFWSRRIGVVLGLAALVFWVGSWLTLAGAPEELGSWSKERFLNASADMGFRVENILVEGRVNTDPDALKAIINLEKGDPLFAFDPYEARGLIEKLAWVRAVRVERRLPDTVYVAIEERQPLVLWQRNKKLSLVDEDGVVLTDHKLERFSDLIIVVGEEAPAQAPALLTMLEAEPSVEERVEAATLVSGRRWDLTLKNGISVKLPEDDLGLALRSLAAMHEQEGLLEKDIISIDLRERGRVIVSTRPGAVQEYKAGFRADGNI